MQRNNNFSLIIGKQYGKVAKQVFLELGALNGWDLSQAYQFEYKRPLYARNADAERKRDIWFICHSNLNNENNYISFTHKNTIKQDCIEEFYLYSNKDQYPLNERIVFAKDSSLNYIFLGIYAPTDPNSKSQYRTYKKIMF